MEFYIYLVLIVLFFIARKRANNKVVYIGVAFALFFLAAYRSLGVGTDSEAYYTIYFQYANNDAYVAANENYKTAEFIWLAMLRYFRNANNYRGSFGHVGCLERHTALLCTQQAKQMAAVLGFPLYLAVLLRELHERDAPVGGNVLPVVGHPFLEKGKNQYYLLLMLLAMAIHMSALYVFLFVWAFYKANLNFDNKLKYALAIAISFTIGMFFTAWFKETLKPIANLFASSNYDYYLSGGSVNESRNLLSNLGLNLIAVFMLYINKDANNIYFKLYILR